MKGKNKKNISGSMQGPVRMCIICRIRFSKAGLTRYVYLAGRPVVDIKKKMEGRGFYVCGNALCKDRLSKYKGWQRTSRGRR